MGAGWDFRKRTPTRVPNKRGTAVLEKSRSGTDPALVEFPEPDCARHIEKTGPQFFVCNQGLMNLLVGYPSGQRGQTVNLLAYAFDGSNPSPTTTQNRKGVSLFSQCYQWFIGY